MITLNSSLPSFSAQAYHKNTEITISSDSFSGWTILFFYPHDESPVCPTELRELARNYTHLQKLNCEVIGISVDTIDVHQRFIQTHSPSIPFPLISDSDYTISKKFHIYNEEYSCANRGTYIVNPEGKISYVVLSPGTVARSITETIRVLQALQSGELCTVDWKPN